MINGGNSSIFQQALESSYKEEPWVFVIFLTILCLSNLLALMMRLYKNSIPGGSLNILLIVNYYIVEAYNLFVSVNVSYLDLNSICQFSLFLKNDFNRFVCNKKLKQVII